MGALHTFEGVDYSGTVTAGGGGVAAPNTWALDTPIPSSVLGALDVGSAIIASATVSDAAGNTVETPATVDVVPYEAANSYLTQVNRVADEIRLGIFIDPRSQLVSPEGYFLSETVTFDTDNIIYIIDGFNGTVTLGDQPNFAPNALSIPVDINGALAGEVTFEAGWIGTESPPDSGIIIIPAVPNPAVARVTFSLQDQTLNGIIRLDLDSGGIKSTTFIGSNNGETLTATNTDTVLQGRGGDDTIDMSAGGVNTVIFEADPAANGLDTITGFSVASDTALPDRIGFAGLDNSTLRGAGTDFQALGVGGTLGADTGFVVLTFNLTGLSAGNLATAAEDLLDEAGGDIIYLLATDGDNAALARVTYNNVDDASAEIMANFTGLGDLSGITANEILGFSTV